MSRCGITAPPSREFLISKGDEAQSYVAAWSLTVFGELESCAARHGGLVATVRNYQGRINELNAQANAAQN
jgi:hypothetical protein